MFEQFFSNTVLGMVGFEQRLLAEGSASCSLAAPGAAAMCSVNSSSTIHSGRCMAVAVLLVNLNGCRVSGQEFLLAPAGQQQTQTRGAASKKARGMHGTMSADAVAS